jgi:CheY-like chemotaxis protein
MNVATDERTGTPAGGDGPVRQGEPVVSCRLDGLRVLVVDDDPDLRELLVESLAPTGAVLATAASAAEAMAEFRRCPPHVLISDIGMPGESGLDLIRRVRALPREAGGLVPAAALTAYASEADRRAALEAGYQLHIAKPVDPMDLCELVAKLARGAVP